MPNTVLIGAQWGDEGKGKIIDVLTEDVQWIVRYQGGNNAGHTIEIGDEKFVLHLIPSGVLRPDRRCVIGNGVVVDALALVTELEELKERGVDAAGRLFVSDRAHAVFPYHRLLDECREGALAKGEKIGTTKRGIGPSYGDKVNRLGLRMGDFLDPAFSELLASRVADKNKVLVALGAEPLDATDVVKLYTGAAEKLKPYITDAIVMLNEAVSRGESILFEGAQGTMLDIDFGTFPFVTSSNATAGGACTGSGIAPQHIHDVLGVIKAYTTRVGEGPFPTELLDEQGEQLRAAGHEFGATTGRPRRCGWFDAVVARYSAMLNGVNSWALTKLDVLDGVETIKVAVAYEADGKRLEHIPGNIRTLEACKPIYEEHPGWMTSTAEAQTFEALPPEARSYVRRLEEVSGVPVSLLSVGPRRDSTIRMTPGKAAPAVASL